MCLPKTAKLAAQKMMTLPTVSSWIALQRLATVEVKYALWHKYRENFFSLYYGAKYSILISS